MRTERRTAMAAGLVVLAGLGLALLSGCASSNAPATAQIASCDTVTTALLAVNTLDDAGKLSSAEQLKIATAVALVNPYCGAGATLVTTTAAATADITNGIAAIVAVATAHGASK